jgi:hypothetical protein
MARNTKLVTIASGRDKGKGYFLTEMSAFKAEKWAARALLALTAGGAELPDSFDVHQASAAQLATVALSALGGLEWKLVEPLMDEMLECIQFVGNPKNPDSPKLPLSANEDAIEDVTTLVTIRRELIELHLGFSLAGGLRKSVPAASQPDTTMPTSQQ